MQVEEILAPMRAELAQLEVAQRSAWGTHRVKLTQRVQDLVTALRINEQFIRRVLKEKVS